jgi:hypothetical protein
MQGNAKAILRHAWRTHTSFKHCIMEAQSAGYEDKKASWQGYWLSRRKSMRLSGERWSVV